MQLHRQLPELREGSTRRGEDLSDLGAGQHYREPGHTPRAVPPGAPSPTPASPPAPRFASRAEEPGANCGGPAFPWPPGSAVREGGRTFVDADVMAPRASAGRRCHHRRRYHGAETGEPAGRTASTRAGSPAPPLQLIGSNSATQRLAAVVT